MCSCTRRHRTRYDGFRTPARHQEHTMRARASTLKRFVKIRAPVWTTEHFSRGENESFPVFHSTI